MGRRSSEFPQPTPNCSKTYWLFPCHPPSKVSTAPEHLPQQMEKQARCHRPLLMHPQYQRAMLIPQITSSEGSLAREVLHWCTG